VLRCEASPETLRRRIRERAATRRDASDATAAVLEHQLANQELPDPAEAEVTLRVDTESRIDAAELAATIRART
jgi:predicted kinase